MGWKKSQSGHLLIVFDEYGHDNKLTSTKWGQIHTLFNLKYEKICFIISISTFAWRKKSFSIKILFKKVVCHSPYDRLPPVYSNLEGWCHLGDKGCVWSPLVNLTQDSTIFVADLRKYLSPLQKIFVGKTFSERDAQSQRHFLTCY